MTQLIFLLEEPSAKEMLKGFLPTILPDTIHPEYRVFEGKQDLEKALPGTLRAWRKPQCVFVVIRDQDHGDCKDIKKKLTNLCRQGNKADVLVRIACRELESFYLGDLAAVEKGLGLKGIANKQVKRKFREPDGIVNPSRELSRLTSGCYSKVAGSRAIGPHLSAENNRSRSFNILVAGIRRIAVSI